MTRQVVIIHYASFKEESSKHVGVLKATLIALTLEVEKLFRFTTKDEVLHWMVDVPNCNLMTAKTSVVKRSDLESPIANKHGVVIVQACCPDLVFTKKGRCGFVHEEHRTIKKIAPLVVEKLNKTRA